MVRRIKAAIVLMALVATAGLVSGVVKADSESLTTLAAADNAFGFRLANAVQKKRPQENIILSPVSAALDLAIALNGATDQTAQEMTSALSLKGTDLTSINTGNAALIRTLRQPVKGVTFSLADAVFADSRRVTLRDKFIARARQSYDAMVANLDFGDSQTPAHINEWVSGQTHGRIPRIIDGIDPALVALLLNAVYFKGDWTYKFDMRKTSLRDFSLADGSVRRVERMSQSGQFDYFETPDFQAIRLPYTTGQFAMCVFLPSRTSSLSAFEAQLTPLSWNAWEGRFSRMQGTIELPRFELKNKYDLTQPLQDLGMRRAFTAAAQFANMSPNPVKLSYVRQSTFLKVDEKGSEAAAVTSIGVVAIALPAPIHAFSMIVDRPFFCAIEDLRSHALLFVGAIYDPTTTNAF